MESIILTVLLLLILTTFDSVSSINNIPLPKDIYHSSSSENKHIHKRYTNLKNIYPLTVPKWPKVAIVTDPTTEDLRTTNIQYSDRSSAVDSVISPTPEPTPRPTESPAPTKPLGGLNKTPYHSLRYTDAVNPSDITHKPTPNPTPQPTTRPSERPTYDPTDFPTDNPTKEPIDSPDSPEYGITQITQSQIDAIDNICPDEMSTDFIVLFDNSCTLSTDHCSNLLHGVSKIIHRLLTLHSDSDSRDSWTTTNRVQTMQIRPMGHAKMVVAFDDDDLQNNPQKYVEFVNEHGKCTDTDTETTDVVKALRGIMRRIDVEDDRKDKIIIVSVCMDDRKEKLCTRIHKQLSDLEIETFIINLIDGSDAMNVITRNEADMYLSCVPKSDVNRVCIGQHTQGVWIDEFDGIIENCLLPQICAASTSTSSKKKLSGFDESGFDESDEQLVLPTPEPTGRPSLSPTPHPIMFGCDPQLLNGEQVDFIIFIDDSCGLHGDDCDNLLEGIGEFIYKLLDYPHTRIATIEFGGIRGHSNLLVDYSDIRLQSDAHEYVSYIRENTKCRCHANGRTNLYTAMKRALQLIDYKKITKFIVVSACMDTTGKVCNMARNEIETYVVNLILGTTDHDVHNMIQSDDANHYLSCLTHHKHERICVSDDINVGVMVSEFDDLINDCLMPRICMTEID